jgi:hypothetical protein
VEAKVQQQDAHSTCRLLAQQKFSASAIIEIDWVATGQQGGLLESAGSSRMVPSVLEKSCMEPVSRGLRAS